jgi:hypothetical protein
MREETSLPCGTVHAESVAGPAADLAGWRLAGVRSGQAYEARLHAIEYQERVERVSRMPLLPEKEPVVPASPVGVNTSRLERVVDLIRDFNPAPSRSRARRLLRAFRRRFSRVR